MRTRWMIALLLSLGPVAHADESLVHRWRFTAEHVRERNAKPIAGALDAALPADPRFDVEGPKALILDGGARQKIAVADDVAKAKLPAKAITVEAWVRVDRMQDWGGFAGAFQDNGSYEKGWILGFEKSKFFFAVATKKANRLTYLRARTHFQAGYWYHVLGTYDGQVQRLYVDGRLQGEAREQSGDVEYPPKAFFTLAAYHDDNELYPVAGRLEQVSVWERALTGEQVSAHFRSRKNLFPEIDPPAPDGSDWPTYLRDTRRLGLAGDEPAFPLKLKWVHKGRYAPQPSWPEEAKQDFYHDKKELAERVTYDRGFHLVGAGDRVWFASSADDKVYCLDADTGKERWSFFTEGPVRLAPALAGDRVLFGSDDGFVYCLRARDGVLEWKRRLAPTARRIPGNDRIVSAWPVRTDVLIDGDRCHVCCGVFPSQGVDQVELNLRDGKELSRKPLKVTAQGYLERVAGKLLVHTGRDPAGAFLADLKRLGKDPAREANPFKEYPFAYIGAGDVRLGGGDGKIAAFRPGESKPLWSATVEGKVHSLAIVRGRLLASTDKGHVYCFAPGKEETKVVTPASPVEPKYSDTATRERTFAAAEWIVKRADVSRGYCLVLGSGDGWLAYELARRTEWRVIGVEPDEGKVERSRRMLDAAGVHGRVSIHHGPLDALPYTDYPFNVVVSDTVLSAGEGKTLRAEVMRVLRPEGGLAVFSLDDKGAVRRGALEGAGEWTHMYGDPGNTACSGDRLAGSELELQWFGRPGPRMMMDRHHRTSPPLYKAGRMFVPGEDRVSAVDAYNGVVLWEVDVKDSRRVAVFRDNGHLAAASDALYVAAGNRCLALDPATGKTKATHELPKEFADRKYDWGYVAVPGDVLLGSGVKAGSIRRTQNRQMTLTETHWDFVPAVGSDFLFARDRASGKALWTYRARAGLIVNPTLTVGDGRLFFVESDNPATLKAPVARAKMAELLGEGASVVALDLKTGKELWRQSGKAFAGLHHNIFASFAQHRLVVVGSRNSGTDKKKDRVVYDVHVFDDERGALLWTKSQTQGDLIGGEHGEQERHPVIVGDRLYCEPFAYNLHTGEKLEWKWPWGVKRRSGCGTLSASATCFFFRHETMAAFDLEQGKAKPITAETRPGCWINVLPAGGLVLAPEASSGCTCNFAVQTSLALKPKR